MPKTVSIIIPAYNSAQYLPDAIESCIAQTFKDIEIIVVDDGSYDNTSEVAHRFPVTYIFQPNAGPGAARNNGWRVSDSEFIQFLDADDVLLPTKIERCLQAFTPDIDVVYTNYEMCSADLRESLATPKQMMPATNMLLSLLNTTQALTQTAAPLIRRSAADRTRKFPEKFNIAEDWYLWIELAARGAKFRHLDEVLVRYRVTPGSLTKDPVKMAQGRLEAAEALSELPLPKEFDLNQLLIDRHHVLGLRLWATNNRLGARKQFWQAIKLSPKGPRNQMIRFYFILMTYFSNLEAAELNLNRVLRVFKKT